MKNKPKVLIIGEPKVGSELMEFVHSRARLIGAELHIFDSDSLGLHILEDEEVSFKSNMINSSLTYLGLWHELEVSNLLNEMKPVRDIVLEEKSTPIPFFRKSGSRKGKGKSK